VALLERYTGDDLARAGEAIRQIAHRADTMERAAQLVVDRLWDDFRDEDGEPACALVRLYKTHRYRLLPPDLAAFAQGILGTEPPPDTRCLSLLATRGLEEAWNDRRRSEGHRAIPLPTEDFVGRLPMVAGLIEQLGLDIADVLEPERPRILELVQRTYGAFHVPIALGSPYLPAQDFVARYGIQSAVGFGGVLFSGDFFAVVFFSRVPVSEAVADTVRVLSLATRVALQPFGARVFA
jgi:hypothetical protein